MEECDLQMVYCDTLDWLRENKTKFSIPTPRLYTTIFYPPTPIIIVTPIHPIEAGYRLLKEKYYGLVLHVTSAFKPGCNVDAGLPGWDGDFFRRGDYKDHLHPSYFPLQQDHVIITPRVTIFKNSEYQILDHPFLLDVIACAPFKCTYYTKDGEMTPDDTEIVRFKIRQIVTTAAALGYNALVLRDFGCNETFRNPPAQIAKFYKEALSLIPANSIKKIVFCVDPRHLSIFSEILT